METKECKKCGVILCDKNIFRIKARQCKQCATNSKSCKIIYDDKYKDLVLKNANRIAARLNYIKHIDKRLATCRRYRDNPMNKKIIAKAKKDYYNRNTELCKQRTKEWISNNITKHRERNNKAARNSTASLDDEYIKSRLRFIGITTDKITPELIEIKRKQLILKRYAKENTENSTENR